MQLGKILFSSGNKFSQSPFGGSNIEQLLYRSNMRLSGSAADSIPAPGTRLNQAQVDHQGIQIQCHMELCSQN